MRVREMLHLLDVGRGGDDGFVCVFDVGIENLNFVGGLGLCQKCVVSVEGALRYGFEN